MAYYQPDIPVLIAFLPSFIEGDTSHLERAALLLLYSFVIRLINEDYGYICAFVERHLSLKCALKVPNHWQQMSPPQQQAVS
jgi:hypothetical protein